MLKEFESNILKNQLFSKQDYLLLAISGGVDSVVLAHLLKMHHFNFELAHCNFKLRGMDSNKDEIFCKLLAKKLGVKIYFKHFDIATYCKVNKVSIQMAARDLRYAWFNELMQKNKMNVLLTAHHANDVVETFFINLCRGTGINGLKGIPIKSGNCIRPLINFTKQEIVSFAKSEKIKYRTDKSNLETKYERNLLRLKIIPELKKIHPNLEYTFLNNTQHFKEEADIVSDFLQQKAKLLFLKKENYFLINKVQLKKEKHLTTLLHYMLEPFGFNATQVKDMITNIQNNGNSGKLFFSLDYTLTIDRDFIIIKVASEKKVPFIKIQTYNQLKNTKNIKITEVTSFKSINKNELIIEKDKLVFPLIIRTKKDGDKFKPFGMKGFKLISDFLKDEKLNAFEKENCQLLENGNGDIIWVIGYRSDERYKIIAGKTDLLKITAIE